MGGSKKRRRDVREIRNPPTFQPKKQSIVAIARSHPILVFLFASACWAVFLYFRAFAGNFLYDDLPQIQNNPNLTSWQGAFHYFRSAVPFSNEYLTSGGSFYRPIFWISLAIDRYFWELQPAGFHATNLLLHWVNGFLLFLLLRKTAISDVLCAAITFLWLGLPINSEVVTWISGRCIALATLFVLSSLSVADWFLQSKRFLLLPLWFFLSLAAMLSYEVGILAFPLALLWIYFRKNDTEGVWLPLSLAGIGAYAAAFGLRSIAGAMLPLSSLSIARVGPAFFQYLQWMILPIHMSVERSTNLPPDHFSWWAGVALAGLLLLMALTVVLWNKLPIVSFGLAWLCLGLLPFCGLVSLYQGMAERYEYLASMGLAIVIVLLSQAWKSQFQRVALLFIGAWMVWGVWRLHSRVLDWTDEFTLDQSSLEATPRSSVLLYNLAIEEAKRGDVQSSMADYQRALALNPHYSSALLNLGNLLRKQGRYTEAIATYRRLLEIDPQSSEGWMDMGNVYLQTNSWEEARNAYEKAVAVGPTNVQALIDLGTVFQYSGDLLKAKQQYERAIAIDSRQSVAYCNLGTVFLQQGDTQAALSSLNKSIELDPRYPAAYFDLGVLYEHIGRSDSAVEMYTKALALKPDYQNARNRLDSLRGK